MFVKMRGWQLLEYSCQKRNDNNTTTILRPFFRDHPDQLVPEENFWTLYTSLFHRLGRKKTRNMQANKQQEIEKKHDSNTYLTVNRSMLMLLHTTTHLKLHICHY